MSNFKSVPSSSSSAKQLFILDENNKKTVDSYTGTKRKSTFKAIKPNSLKNSSEIDGKKSFVYKI